MLKLEFSEPHVSDPCDCCGGRTISLTRFVTEDGDAFAIYYIRFSETHADKPALATVSIGDWGESASPDQRHAFAMELAPEGVRIIDASESPWNGAQLIGRTLDREEALEHPRIKDVFHIADHVYLEDAEFKAYLGRMNSAERG